MLYLMSLSFTSFTSYLKLNLNRLWVISQDVKNICFRWNLPYVSSTQSTRRRRRWQKFGNQNAERRGVVLNSIFRSSWRREWDSQKVFSTNGVFRFKLASLGEPEQKQRHQDVLPAKIFLGKKRRQLFKTSPRWRHETSQRQRRYQVKAFAIFFDVRDARVLRQDVGLPRRRGGHLLPVRQSVEREFDACDGRDARKSVGHCQIYFRRWRAQPGDEIRDQYSKNFFCPTRTMLEAP